MADAKKNWIWAYPKTNYDDYDDDMFWFYLDNKGKPVLANGDNSTSGNAIDYSDNAEGKTKRTVVAKSIKNKTYIFDDAGCMRTGLFKLDGVKKGKEAADETGLSGYFYFTEDDSHGSTEGQMVTNKKMTVDVDGTDKTYYFKKSGEAYINTIISSSLYVNDGALVDDYGHGATYARVELTTLEDKYGLTGDIKITEKGKSTSILKGATILLNGNGKIKKSGTVTDIDGYKVTVKDYVVDEVKDSDGKVIKKAVYQKDDDEKIISVSLETPKK